MILTVNGEVDLGDCCGLYLKVNPTLVKSLVVYLDLVYHEPAGVVRGLVECSALEDSIIRPVSCFR